MTGVASGEAAIQAAEIEWCAMVLLDLGLPKPDGLAVLPRFGKRRNQLPMIIVTACDGVEDRIGGLDLARSAIVSAPA